MATIPSVIAVLGNMRFHTPQQVDPRPGMIALPNGPFGLKVHSIRRMNSGASFIRLVGADTNLIEIVSGATIGTGFSGNPLSMVPFRPEQSPLPWMYIADSTQMRKIAMDNTNWQMGVAPPLNPPTVFFGPPSYQFIYDFSAGTGNIPTDWIASGTAGAQSSVQWISDTLTTLISDTGAGVPSYFSIAPGNQTPGTYTTNSIIRITQPGIPVVSKSFTLDNVLTSPWATTTISKIVYASGSTGAAVVTLPSSAGVIPNRLIVQLGTGGLNSEYVQAIGCVQNPDGTFSFSCTTVNTHAAGETVTSKITLRVFITGLSNTAAFSGIIGDAMTASINTGTGSWTLTRLENLSTTLINGVRAIQTAMPSDTIYVSFSVSDWSKVTSLAVLFDVDSTNNNFSSNYYSYTTAAGFPGAGNSRYTLAIPVSSLVRTGTDTTRTLANVAAVRITMVVSGNIGATISSFWIGGNYGPTTTALLPYFFRIVARSSRTGALSNGSPAIRVGLVPTGNGMSVAVFAGNDPDPQVDSLDVYRFGGTLPQWTFVGTMPNPVGNGLSVLFDVFQDTAIANSPIMATDNFQPFPTVDLPRSGVVTVSGTTVTWVSGDKFNTQWAPGTQIIINGIVYNLYQQPQSTTSLQIVQQAGTLGNVNYSIPQATILGVALPVLWGPFAQGTAAFMFACGDVNQPGVLFLTKGNNPDAGPDVLQIEITSPTEPLMNGCMYDGTSFVWSSDRLFRLYPLFGQTIIVTNGTIAPASGTNLFTPIEVPNGKGLFARWCLAVGPKIWFGGRDGIYETTGGEPKLLTTGDWGQLFPHEGVKGIPITLANGLVIQPPDPSVPNTWRLSYYDSDLYFDFQDVTGKLQTLVYDTEADTWSYDTYTPTVVMHYGEEGQGVHSILMGGSEGNVYQAGGQTDASATPIPCALTVPLAAEGMKGFQVSREAYLGLFADAAMEPLAFLALQMDGSVANVNVPMTTGYQRLFTNLPALKGRLQGWALSSVGPFTIILRDCEFYIKEWGSSGPYQPINPFSSMKRVQGARVQ